MQVTQLAYELDDDGKTLRMVLRSNGDEIARSRFQMQLPLNIS